MNSSKNCIKPSGKGLVVNAECARRVVGPIPAKDKDSCDP